MFLTHESPVMNNDRSAPAGAGRVAVLRIGVFAVLGWVSAPTIGAPTLPAACGTLVQQWGPFDYRADRYIPETFGSHKALLAAVENHHFTPEVEVLIRGKTGVLPGGDLSYTLGVFPNHHRALIAVSKLAVREKSSKPTETRYSVECYFERAMAFRPDDMLVRMIYANYLIQVSRIRDAEFQIDTVAQKNPDDGFTQRNMSLLYFDAKSYDKALVHAHKAGEMGMNIGALKEKLRTVGKWQDAPTPDRSAASQGPQPAQDGKN